MRKKVALATLMFAMTLTAQENRISVSNYTEVSKNLSSKSIIGVWKQTGMLNRYTGKYDHLKNDIYKVVNADGTYFIVISLNSHNDDLKRTAIISHGTYELTSNDSFIESDRTLTNSKVKSKNRVKFKLLSHDSMTSTLVMDKGVSGKWTRSVPPLNKIAFENLKNRFINNTNNRTLL